MSVNYTNQQKCAFTAKGNALLVSAAAGSGKTAVLVERVLKYLTEEQGDIRRLMITTFTEAAAAEMRQKIKKRVDAALQKEPSDHLMRQSALIESAEIGTVHSICLRLITRYFDKLDLDPRMRLMDESDEQDLQLRQAEQLLEELYAEKNPAVVHFLRCYASGRNDEQLRDHLIRGAKFLDDQPLPERYIYRSLSPYRKRKEDLFYRFIEDGLCIYLKDRLDALCIRLHFLFEKWTVEHNLAQNEAIQAFFEEQKAEIGAIASLPEQHHFNQFSTVIRTFKFGTIRWKNWLEGEDEGELELMKKEWESYKKAVNDLLAPFKIEEADAVARLDLEGKRIRTYFDLCNRLRLRLHAARKAGGWITFGDMERLAVELLVEQYDAETDTLIPSEIARQLQGDYDEIIVDEFQDTNRNQDLIFRALSQGESNLFMVGDLKQSIYRFRGAEPEIFDQKRKQSASLGEADPQSEEQMQLRAPTVLELNANFRSHPGVLHFANAVFAAIMSEQVGGVTYDEREILRNGRQYTAPEQLRAEIHWIPQKEMDAEGNKIKPIQQNARYAAALIQKMVAEQELLLLPDGESRPVEYRDFCILLRNAAGVADLFEKELLDRGIPVLNRNEGLKFFDLPEVQSVLSYLLVLNNPYDDVALVSLLFGDYFCFTLGELADLRQRKAPLYDNLKEAAKSNDKAKSAFETIEGYRNLAGTFYVYDLLQRIYRQSGVPAAYAARGDREKCANLELLAEDARLFEKEGYRGLYAFVQHIRVVRSSAQGGARLQADPNSVKIMTIHKSKGLEFPICILGDGQKTFSRNDTKEKILLHPRFGAAVEEMDPDRFYRAKSISQRVLSEQIVGDSISEEERVLYVALTRPESKMIILANEEEETVRQWVREGALLGRPLPRWLLTDKDASYNRWLITLLAGAKEGELLRARFGLPLGNYPPLFATYVLAEELPASAKAEAQGEQKPAFNQEAFFRRLDWKYPHADAIRLPAKLSVSELKGIRPPEEDAEPLFADLPRSVPPRFIQKRRANEVGNALHQALQFCDFSRLKKDAAGELDRLVTRQFITAEQREMIDLEQVERFTQSPCFEELFAADRYYKEERFLFPMKAKELFQGGGEEEILIRGVLDCYAVRGNTATILDYKTDRVQSAKELIDRYRIQLELYALALERVKGLKVNRKVIYSFALGQEIEV
jgi:ATP-dependent helicase/nuclease subunit A